MKRMFLSVLLLLSQVVNAKEQSIDWGSVPSSNIELHIPSDIMTMSDYQRYADIRKGAFAIGLLFLGGALVVDRQRVIYKRKADEINIAPGPRVFDPAHGYYYYPVVPGLAEGQRRYMHKARMVGQIEIAMFILSALGFTTALSLRF